MSKELPPAAETHGAPRTEQPRRYQTGKHLEAFLLLLVWERADHGGSLMARLQAMLPDRWTIDSGRLYRTLRDLEASGVLSSSWEMEDTGAPIRVYRITQLGLLRLEQWKDEMAVRRDSLNAFLSRCETPRSRHDP
ncbi:MAG: PadR family transcriptional regulator [Thermaerobacter sp.]|nr:PadR family transcriptional regulator [Thermaerobacter sp.]